MKGVLRIEQKGGRRETSIGDMGDSDVVRTRMGMSKGEHSDD